MEPWSFGSDGKGLLFSDEMGSPLDVFDRSRKSFMEMETRPYYNFENSIVLSDKVASESVEFMELGFSDAMRKHFHCNQAVGVYGGEVGSDSGKRVVSPTCMLTPNSSLGEVESISVMECNSQDSSLIDLKLGRLVDGIGANTKFSKGRSVLASGGSAVVAKKARTTPTNSHTSFCQVQGCNMDLSSSKEYHKRHKVCDAHSKTARVIVNGMEQRFCQQCSRFHLLVEFDDGKRSCRKRLAGHNERRRKPQLDSFSGKPHKFLHSIQDTGFLTSSLPKRSHAVFPNIHRGGNLYLDRYGEANQYQHIKSEQESIFNPHMAVPMMNTGKSFHLHSIGKQHCSRGPLDTASHVQEVSEASNSSCALSLLSTQSQGIPLFYPGEHVCGERLARMNYGGKYAANGLYSNPVDVEQIMLSDADFEVHSKGILHGSGFSSYKHSLSPEHGTTVDLLQLSSHLQRVERQRGSMPVKQEREDFSCFLATQGV